MFKDQWAVTNRLIRSAKRVYYIGLIDASPDSEVLFTVTNHLSEKKILKPMLHDHTTAIDFLSRLNQYFVNKIKLIPESLNPPGQSLFEEPPLASQFSD